MSDYISLSANDTVAQLSRLVDNSADSSRRVELLVLTEQENGDYSPETSFGKLVHADDWYDQNPEAPCWGVVQKLGNKDTVWFRMEDVVSFEIRRRRGPKITLWKQI